MKKCERFSRALICWLLCALSLSAVAQVYSPVLILNSANTKPDDINYTEHSPGSSVGFGLVAYFPSEFGALEYRGSLALQNRKFKLAYLDIPSNQDVARRYTAGTFDIGAGVSYRFLDMLGVFVGAEATWIAKVECEGGSPCTTGGGDVLAAQLQAGFNVGPNWMKFEPYWEYMPFSPVRGVKSLTTYGLAIHFFPESFSP